MSNLLLQRNLFLTWNAWKTGFPPKCPAPNSVKMTTLENPDFCGWVESLEMKATGSRMLLMSKLSAMTCVKKLFRFQNG